MAAATNTIQPDWAMSNWYEMKMPETVAVTAKHIESIIGLLEGACVKDGRNVGQHKQC